MDNWSQVVTRRSPGGILYGVDHYSGTYSYVSPLTIRGRQITSDENHHLGSSVFNAEENRGDVGGYFNSERYGISVLNSRNRHIWGVTTVGDPRYEDHYHGPYVATDPQTITTVPSLTSRSDEDLKSTGDDAVRRCKPTNNVANVFTDISETYHEGLPKLYGVNFWKERTRVARGAGSEYLNQEFGWKPLVSDVRDVAYAAANSHSILSRYESNSGKLVRRRFEFPIDYSETDTLLSPSHDGIIYAATLAGLQDQSKPRPAQRKRSTVYRRTWFSGAFTYHLPIGYKSRNGMISAAAKAGPLLGIEITPETLWNAAPWTWALNWFSNAGDVVSYLSDWAVDGLVMRRGYIMEHCVSKDIYYLDQKSRFLPDYPEASAVVCFHERKKRIKATPFGFHISWESFSPRQLAIAAALGITRVF